MFHFEREYARAVAEAEAGGENLWTTSVSREVREKILFILEQDIGSSATLTYCRNLLTRALGTRYLFSTKAMPGTDMQSFLRHCDDTMFMSVCEAVVRTAANWDREEVVRQGINEILRHHRIAFSIEGSQAVPFSSTVAHVGIVVPTLSLLAGQPELAEVEKAFQDALRERDARDAITDAASALQSMLTHLGCQGGSIGKQMDDARKKGVLAAHDSPMLKAFEAWGDWVEADRSTQGDAHPGGNPSPADAWFVIHVVGALILRLAHPELRGS